jgi:hypothetical protein
MGKVQCWFCKEWADESLPLCPHCGARVRKKGSPKFAFVLSVVLLAILVLMRVLIDVERSHRQRAQNNAPAAGE